MYQKMNDMIVSSIIIKASAHEIWEALTERDNMKEWYFDIPDFQLKVGATFNFYEPGDTKEFLHQCVVKEINPNKVFSHTWTHPDHSKGESIVTWMLDELEEGTLVTLTHSGIEGFANIGRDFTRKNYQLGWDGYMFILKNYCYKTHPRIYAITIEATAEQIWNALFDVGNYKLWTAVFCPGSYYRGELEIGKRIHFLNPSGAGIFSKVFYKDYPKMLVFQHEGTIKDYKEQPVIEEIDKWAGSFERYILIQKDNCIRLIAEVDVTADHIAYFDEYFPKGLEIVKELAEK